MYTTSPRGTRDITSELFVIQEQSGNHVPQADFSVLILLWLGQIASGWPTNCSNVRFDFNSEIRSIAHSTPCKARQGIYSKRPQSGTGDMVPTGWASLNSTRPRIVLPRQLFLTTSSSRSADCHGQFALVLRWLQSVGDVAIHERHARQPLAQYRLRERNKLGSNGAVCERMHAISASFGAYWQGRSRVIAS